MSSLHIRLLGKFSAQRDGQDLPGLHAKRLQELLGYLLLQRHRVHPREAMAGQLWGDIPTAESRKHLRQALWQLNAALDGNGAETERMVLVEPDWVQINPQAELWLDVDAMTRTFARLQGVPGRDLDPLQARALRDAVDLYRGDLLEGCYQEWCLAERDRLRNLFLWMSDKLMRAYEAGGDYERGLLLGAQSLRCEPARERTHRLMMRLYCLLGDRTAALRQYDRCVQALRQDLAVRPSACTVALYQAIRHDQLDAPLSRRQTLDHLRAVLAALDLALDQVRREIRHLDGLDDADAERERSAA